MATTFNMLRANDLIWSFVINNYLLGKDPFPFDLLYWNSDITRMPARMHSFYLRKCYQENVLVAARRDQPRRGADRSAQDRLPVYWVSTREDHIAPWKMHLCRHAALAGRSAFVLAARATSPAWSIRRPPASTATGSTSDLPADPDAWFEGPPPIDGSWWTDWHRWVSAQAKAQVPARVPGDGRLKPIEDAPGSYVKVRVG